jgi:hypothetical protein
MKVAPFAEKKRDFSHQSVKYNQNFLSDKQETANGLNLLRRLTLKNSVSETKNVLKNVVTNRFIYVPLNSLVEKVVWWAPSSFQNQQTTVTNVQFINGTHPMGGLSKTFSTQTQDRDISKTFSMHYASRNFLASLALATLQKDKFDYNIVTSILTHKLYVQYLNSNFGLVTSERISKCNMVPESTLIHVALIVSSDEF